jgi:hypothetical protein
MTDRIAEELDIAFTNMSSKPMGGRNREDLFFKLSLSILGEAERVGRAVSNAR